MSLLLNELGSHAPKLVLRVRAVKHINCTVQILIPPYIIMIVHILTKTKAHSSLLGGHAGIASTKARFSLLVVFYV
jgi:hypothetical protein